MTGVAQGRIAAAYYQACLDELRAPKAGNVHDFSHGHGMTVGEFELSADVTREWIARPGARVGTRVRGAIAATRKAVACNTNLGIVLMSAPIARATEQGGDLRPAVNDVLAELDVEDASDVFAAIVLASPAGLGEAPENDVRAPATVTLLEAMRSAADRDRIAWNYANGLADIFEIGLPRFRHALDCWNDWLWATAAVHFAFMGAFPDTHILREHGASAAAVTCKLAAGIETKLMDAREPQALMDDLLRLDRHLKAKGWNPGTSADLTVATLFAARLAGDLPSGGKNG